MKSANIEAFCEQLKTEIAGESHPPEIKTTLQLVLRRAETAARLMHAAERFLSGESGGEALMNDVREEIK